MPPGVATTPLAASAPLPKTQAAETRTPESARRMRRVRNPRRSMDFDMKDLDQGTLRRPQPTHECEKPAPTVPEQAAAA
jgi:hypothetical protein